MQPAETRTGSIYDLGYRTYDGPRLGRRHAVSALYWYTLRGAFGIGRRTGSKIMPIIIAVFAFIPAIVQLGVAALFTDEAEIFEPEDYFGFVEVPIALFCAVIAPEIAGRDMRQRTLSLYFSRALHRQDYALAKIAAFASALTLLTLGPQVVLLIGNGLATDDIWGYIEDNWADLPRTLASGALIAVTAASVCLALASQTPRRAYATIAVIAWFLVLFPVGGALVYGVGGAGTLAVFISPFTFLHGCTMFVFGVDPSFDDIYDEAGYPMWTYLVTVVAYAAAGTAIVLRRFARVAA